jgi:hypothetical protein
VSALTDWGARASKLGSPAIYKKVARAGGMAGKESALEAASRDLGGDRAFSGMRRKVKLGVGFDQTGPTEITINFRPGGLWTLAQQGRRSSGPIRPKRKRALVGRAFGPVGASRFGPSRGLGTFTDAVTVAKKRVPKAAHAQFVIEVARVMGGR